MRFSARTEYACLALLELARDWPDGEPRRLREIADEHGIPSRFLVQILLQLKAAGLVLSTRGAGGGYQLARTPEAISLADVVAAIEGPFDPESIKSSLGGSPAARVIVAPWRDAARREHELLRETSLSDLAARLRRDVEAMYYI